MNYKEKIKLALKSNFDFFIIEGNQDICIDILENIYIDYFIVFLNGKELNAEQIRQLVADLLNMPDRNTIYIIKDFDHLSEIIQNILLKSLEELSGIKIIGLCSSAYKILDTVLSRGYHLFINDNIKAISNSNIFLSSLLDRNFTIDNIDFYKNKSKDLKIFNKNHKYNLELIQLKKRIDANCNKDLCLDLFLYKLLEE